MELRVLQYFLAIAREENISKAANYLHITQPTLSRQIKELEDELDTQLFVRGNRKITLTEDGMLLRNRAQQIVSLVEKTENEITSSDDNLSGEIHIGAAETQAMNYIIDVMKSTREDHQDIKFSIFSGNGLDVKERLDKGLIDFGLLIEPVDISKYNHIKIPTTHSWGLLMKSDHPLASKKHITPDDLTTLPLICSRQEMVHGVIAGWMNNDNPDLNIVTSYNLIYNAILMVKADLGVAITIDNLVDTKSNPDLAFVPLYPKVESGIVLVWNKYQVFSKASQYFIKQLQESLM